MARIQAISPEANLGFQIIYKGANTEKEVLTVGASKCFPFEIIVYLDCMQLTNSDPCGNCKFSFLYDSKKKGGLNHEQIDIAPNMLIIRCSRELFSILTLEKQFPLGTSLFNICKKDLLIHGNSIVDTLPEKCTSPIKNIINFINNPQPDLYKEIQILAEVMLEFMGKNVDANKYDPSFLNKLEQLWRFIIGKNLAYPNEHVIRKITDITKNAFEEAVRKITPDSLKVSLELLKYKSGLYQIIFTNKPFKDIANEHGFSDATAFTRSIKSKTGHPPKALRQYGSQDLFKLLPLNNNKSSSSLVNSII